MILEQFKSEPSLNERFKGSLFNLDQVKARLRQRDFGGALGYLIDIGEPEAYMRYLKSTDFDYNDRTLSAEISLWWAETGKSRWEEARAEKLQKERRGIADTLKN